ncbi:MAG: GNAT family N-acetyltransferase [Acidimicrobiaceae bacterium]|nr:GNAT family N-acetyltransferase [Acidimicrobiaceae bacterium]MYG55464.1 GNAT family N-acetyltransferase [Acidimicrobiaceae bacterium]MYJ99317.1 GNAT family N-acetyltransferase [Acidimicrobiaceae bacterium]
MLAVSKLFGRRVLLRPLEVNDFGGWQEVRRRNQDWLTQWEPQRLSGAPDVVEDRVAFANRCSARQRERQRGSGHSFGIFVDHMFAGEINLNSIQRGPFQSCYVGYWIDEALAGNGYMPEALVVVARFAFEELRLHRIQVAIVPRNTASRRVVEKLELRDEGTAVRYLEINGVWEDHVRYGLTVEEWNERSDELVGEWISGHR